MTRTSLTDPLRIVALPCGGGVIGMTFCPGKRGGSHHGQAWERDLRADVAALVAWRPSVVVTLMETPEFEYLGVPDLGAAIKGAGLSWMHLPIRDVSIPGEAFERRWVYFGHRLRGLLIRGERVVLHCRGGLGRTGLIAARLLVESGTTPEQAIEQVRAARPGAIETGAQEAYVRRITPVAWDHGHAERVLGTLMGGAVGDAFGYAIEFKRMPEILDCYGPEGLTEPAIEGGVSVVSDDTQMTLFTGEGLARALATPEAQDTDILESIRVASLHWLETQARSGAREGDAGLRRFNELWKRRAPGTTCQSALHAGGMGSPETPINHSKGCGGVMRVAPIGLIRSFTADRAFSLGARAAAQTHGHPSGYLSAGAMAALVRDLVDGVNLKAALDSAGDRLTRHRGHGETLAALRTASLFAASSTPPEEAIPRLGEGWVGEEALAIAVYSTLVGQGFARIVQIAANHSGDSDSTASIAGQLWGAAWGLAGIPECWIQRLDIIDALCETARDLLLSDAAAARVDVRTWNVTENDGGLRHEAAS
jgi:ADP-ribosylglycohydrolase/protein-tyrosine phosphatase